MFFLLKTTSSLTKNKIHSPYHELYNPMWSGPFNFCEFIFYHWTFALSSLVHSDLILAFQMCQAGFCLRAFAFTAFCLEHSSSFYVAHYFNHCVVKSHLNRKCSLVTLSKIASSSHSVPFPGLVFLSRTFLLPCYWPC